MLVLYDPVDLPINESLEFDLRPMPVCLPWDPEKAKEAWEWIKSHPTSGLNISDDV